PLRQQPDNIWLQSGRGDWQGCRHWVYAAALDAAVWGRIAAPPTGPGVITAPPARVRDGGTTQADPAAVDKRPAEVQRQQGNLVDQLANLGGAVAALATEKLGVLESQRQQLLAERERVLARRQAGEAARAADRPRPDVVPDGEREPRHA